MQQQAVELKNKLRKSKIKGIALDIDQTLSATFLQWVKHLLEKFNKEGLTTEEMLSKYRYFREVSYWNEGEAYELAGEMLNSVDFQLTIPLVENSNHEVEKINKFMPVVVYLTARPQHLTEVTKKWLSKHAFPKAEVITRPAEIETGYSWKAELLDYLYPQVLGIVDDDPELVPYLKPDYKGTVYLYNWEQPIDTRQRVVACKDWQHVHELIAKDYGAS